MSWNGLRWVLSSRPPPRSPGSPVLAGSDAELASAIESILLVAGEPVLIRVLARLLDTDSKAIESALDYVLAGCVGRGIHLQSHGGRVQLVTAEENAGVVRTFLDLPRQPRLSRPALETLAIVAYHQPVSRGEIENIRGVNVDRLIANLTARGWIEEAGRREGPGRPIEYRTTRHFLDLFGLSCLEDLPAMTGRLEAHQRPLTILGMHKPA